MGSLVVGRLSGRAQHPLTAAPDKQWNAAGWLPSTGCPPGNRGVAAGIPAIHQRDMQLMNNSKIVTRYYLMVPSPPTPTTSRVKSEKPPAHGTWHPAPGTPHAHRTPHTQHRSLHPGPHVPSSY
eukprot:scaffold32031_cov63-Cyclotella_meneghiniana.AAC.5